MQRVGSGPFLVDVVYSRSPTKDLEADAYMQVMTMDLDPLLRTRIQALTRRVDHDRRT
jgi:hypothetical protein